MGMVYWGKCYTLSILLYFVLIGWNVLSREEFAEFLHAVDINFSRKKWNQIFRDIDLSHDDLVSDMTHLVNRMLLIVLVLIRFLSMNSSCLFSFMTIASLILRRLFEWNSYQKKYKRNDLYLKQWLRIVVNLCIPTQRMVVLLLLRVRLVVIAIVMVHSPESMEMMDCLKIAYPSKISISIISILPIMNIHLSIEQLLSLIDFFPSTYCSPLALFPSLCLCSRLWWTYIVCFFSFVSYTGYIKWYSIVALYCSSWVV